METRQQIKLQ